MSPPLIGASRRSLRLPFQLTLVGLILPLVLGSGLLVSWIGYRRSSAMLSSASNQMLQALGGQLQGAMASALDPQRASLELERLQSLAGRTSLAERLKALPEVRQALAQTPNLRAYFIGFADGQCFVVARATDAVGRRLPGLGANAALVVESLARDVVAGQGVVTAYGPDPALRRQQLVFDSQDRPLPQAAPVQLLPADFDPRQRPWYRLAMESLDTVLSPVYRLALGNQLGLTLSRSLPGRVGVVAASLELGSLEGLLDRHRPTPGSRLAIVNGQGLVLAASGQSPEAGSTATPAAGTQSQRLDTLGVPALRGVSSQLRQRVGRGFLGQRLGGSDWRTAVLPLPSPVQGRPLYLVVAVPDDELLAEARRQQQEGLLVTALVMLLLVPVVLLVAGRLSAELRRLAAVAAAIRRFEFDAGSPLRSFVREVDELSLTLDGLRGTVQRFLAISAMLAAEDDVDRLLEKLLVESIAAAGAQSGALYLPAAVAGESPAGETPAPSADQPQAFEPRLFRQAGQWGQARHLPELAAEVIAQLRGGQGQAAATGPLSSPPLPQGPYLALPLEERLQSEQLGLLVLWFDAAPEPAQVAFCRALSGSAAVALETRELIAAQKRLFEAFIQLIAGAIDAKSPYTGGHCARVPELTKLLAEAACQASDGPFAAFKLDPHQWEALHVAAWLHDCGKVTTPEYVVDKATKLETIHDRIHEVRLRFELLKQQAETEYWQALAAGVEDEGEREALCHQLQRTLAALDDDFAFVASCNQGGEFMAPELLERLQRIAARRWRRTLDDRLGLSRDELRRREQEPQAELPTWEPLLADRPHHRIPRQERDRLAADNPWGFRMEVPEHLYNHGELYNLSVARGTLSAEERFKINEHIIQTIRMLAALPFPRHLRQVSEIAGGHHEMVNGRGYPRGLRGEEMSELARMMAIADIFEALTAADRPYKSGKTLSQALAIMARMAAEGHIDLPLFALFLRAGVHRTYAERHLAPEQIDAVDVESLLAGLTPTAGSS